MPSEQRRFSEPAFEIQHFGVNIVGFSPYTRWTGPMFKPGTTVIGDDGRSWVFGLATAAVVVVPATVVAPNPSTGVAFTPLTGGIAPGAGYSALGSFDAGEYGWIVKSGTGIQ